MKIPSKGNQITVCKDDICLTVAGEFAKALAFVAVVAAVAIATNEIAKLLK